MMGWKAPAESLDEYLRSLHQAGVTTTGWARSVHVLDPRPPTPRRRVLGSMGRVASRVDNGMIESFWLAMQRELLDRQTWTSGPRMGSAIFE